MQTRKEKKQNFSFTKLFQASFLAKIISEAYLLFISYTITLWFGS